MERKLYPVWGYTGEYADYRQWVVGLFPYERSAQAVADRLNEVAREQGVLGGRPDHASRDEDSPAVLALKAAGDHNANIDYTGVGYRTGGTMRQFVDVADFEMTGWRP